MWLNSLIDWADLVVAEGFIEPHFFAGFSGGRKSILPGIAYAETVLANHCSEFIANQYATTGNMVNNPINQDMIYASQKAGLKFILNVVLDSNKKIIGAFAGDPEKAHQVGCDFVKQLAQVKAVPAPIVITSNGGYPLDQNIYQAVKGMTAAEACVEQGGAIVIVASCIDRHGGDRFYEWFANATSPVHVMNKILAITRNQTLPDQWQAQILSRVLQKCTVILVTDMCPPELIENMHMTHAYTLEEGIKKAELITSPNADITVIPDGVGVIIRQ
ncbi:MAG: nickel-dependent lactate racemase [Clostridiales bacterium]|nr:nickel-dependent lactate racemase [Clostridiales bacterium]